MRSLETVMTKLSEANIDLLMLEEDIMPNLLNSFNQEELPSIFRLNHLIEPLRGFGGVEKNHYI